jgi:hypothetical protein
MNATQQGPRPLREIIGERAKAIREVTGVRQDDVARSARVLGLPWGRSKIAALEAGTKAIDAEELVLLPAVLTHACGVPVSLADLLDTDSPVAVSATVAMPARQVAATFAGTSRVPVPATTARSLAGLQAALDRARELGVADVNVTQAVAVRDQSGEADERVARMLDEPLAIVTLLSYDLWKRSLTAERDARVAASLPATATPRTRQAKRAIITRRLVTELRARIGRA